LRLCPVASGGRLRAVCLPEAKTRPRVSRQGAAVGGVLKRGFGIWKWEWGKGGRFGRG